LISALRYDAGEPHALAHGQRLSRVSDLAAIAKQVIVGDELMKLGLALDQWDRSQVLPVALQKIETPAAASRMGLGHERVDAELMCPLRATTTASTMADLTGKVRRF
jgi:hypothetical protein